MNGELKSMAIAARQGRLSRRAFMGQAAALGLSASAASMLAREAYADVPIKGGILRAGMQGGETSNVLDPALNLSQVNFSFGKCWGELLLELQPDGGLENRICEEVGSSVDAKTWTLKIRRGIEFHNGKTVTPEDVLATVERHSDDDSVSPARALLSGIEDIRIDGQDMVFTLREPNADFPYLMADYHLVIQPNGGKDDPNAGISAGPYTVAIDEPGVRYGGERFANYWQGDKLGHADQVEIIVINDTTARIAALRSGQVNMINRVEPAVVELIEDVEGVTIRNVSGRGFYPFNMFCDTAPFDNNDLRMALKLAMDREEMLEKILYGYGEVGNDFPINSAYPLFADDIEQREFDPDLAADYYRRSGHSGPILLRTAGAAFPGAVEAAQLYQQTCAQVGITIEVQREPDDGYWSEIWNKEPFSLSYWGGRATQDQMYSTAYTSTADWNDTRWMRPEFDQMLISARGELDHDKRVGIYRDMAVMLRDEGGLIVPFFNQFIDATGPGVQGWFQTPSDEMCGGYALAACWLDS